MSLIYIMHPFYFTEHGVVINSMNVLAVTLDLSDCE